MANSIKISDLTIYYNLSHVLINEVASSEYIDVIIPENVSKDTILVKANDVVAYSQYTAVDLLFNTPYPDVAVEYLTDDKTVISVDGKLISKDSHSVTIGNKENGLMSIIYRPISIKYQDQISLINQLKARIGVGNKYQISYVVPDIKWQAQQNLTILDYNLLRIELIAHIINQSNNFNITNLHLRPRKMKINTYQRNGEERAMMATAMAPSSSPSYEMEETVEGEDTVYSLHYENGNITGEIQLPLYVTEAPAGLKYYHNIDSKIGVTYAYITVAPFYLPSSPVNIYSAEGSLIAISDAMVAKQTGQEVKYFMGNTDRVQVKTSLSKVTSQEKSISSATTEGEGHNEIEYQILHIDSFSEIINTTDQTISLTLRYPLSRQELIDSEPKFTSIDNNWIDYEIYINANLRLEYEIKLTFKF